MKTALRRRLILTALTAASMCASAALPPAGVERGPQRRVSAAAVETEARVIVKFKADSALMRALAVGSAPALPQHAQALSTRLGLSLTDGRVLGPRTQVLKSRGLSSQELSDRLTAQADVEYAVVDQRMHALAAPNDPRYANGQTTATPAVGQWYLRAPTSATIVNASSVVSSINVEPAWAITTGSSSVVVAVLDTGVRKDHPDLAGKLLAGYDFIADIPTSNDNDARDADASDPGDFGCGETTSSWHGTQTAGLIGAATNNGLGVASVGRNVMVLPLRVLGCGGGYSSDIQAAMLWAAGIDVAGVPRNTTPAKVLNLSLGATGACSAGYADAFAQVNAAGAVVVVAGGNEGLDVGTPANCPGAIGVAGVRHSGSKVGYSDLGAAISIAAPAGNCVNGAGLPCLYPLLTTSNSGVTTPVAGAAGATYTGSGDDASLGTSFSSPLVAGVAALMYSANPTLTPLQVLTALKSSARPFPASGFDVAVKACTAPVPGVAQNTECYCTTTTCGAGLLDAGAAVVAAAAGNAVANISGPSFVTIGGALTLSASGSSASALSATVLTHAWTIQSGAANARISGASNASTVSLATTGVGSVVLGLTVTDSRGKTGTSSMTLAVGPLVSASIAASAPAVATGASIDMDGTGSIPSLGAIEKFQWAVVGSGATFSGSTTGSTATLTGKAAGNVTVTLTVTDSLGNVATTSQALTVVAADSGGGGAMDLGWLLGWLASVIGVWLVTPRSRPR